MTTHRRYFFVHPGVWNKGGHEKILELLQEQCTKNWWYNEPEVKGAPFDKLIIEFTSSGRDQWWCHKRAMKLIEECYMALGMGTKKVPEPLWEPLEPHHNHGRYQIPKAPVASAS